MAFPSSMPHSLHCMTHCQMQMTILTINLKAVFRCAAPAVAGSMSAAGMHAPACGECRQACLAARAPLPVRLLLRATPPSPPSAAGIWTPCSASSSSVLTAAMHLWA